MKLTKRLVSIVLAVLVMFSVATVAVTAQDVELAENRESTVDQPQNSTDNEQYDVCDATYMIAGSELLTGYDWETDPQKAPERVMTNGYGLFFATISDIRANDIYEFMVEYYPSEFIAI